jgi:hypothetical protein
MFKETIVVMFENKTNATKSEDISSCITLKQVVHILITVI